MNKIDNQPCIHWTKCLRFIYKSYGSYDDDVDEDVEEDDDEFDEGDDDDDDDDDDDLFTTCNIPSYRWLNLNE